VRERERIDRTHVRLRGAPALALERKRAALQTAAGRLKALSPRATLERGYAIVRSADEIVRSAAALVEGARVEVELGDGGFGARVEETRP
jgi:exodeoxyribonuclease VII large subunit